MTEFADKGLAGARTEQIAAAAGVNKALLYYYFDSKEKLYRAALELASAQVRDRAMAVFLREESEGERLLRLVLDHFDRILTQTVFQRVMQQEMMRQHKGEAGEMPLLVERVFAPSMKMFASSIGDGMTKGELIETDWLQVVLATLGANIFYFMSSSMLRLVLPFDPLAPDEISRRRAEMVRFLGQTLFVDRQHGAELAAKVLADTPMPEKVEFKSLR